MPAAPSLLPSEEPAGPLASSVAGLEEHDDDDDGLRPILECVVRHSSGSYTAYFGFKNETSQSITVPPGASNSFSPVPQNRNQPTTFPRGRSPYYPNAAFSVPFNGSSLTWTLRGPGHHARSVTARSSSPRCQALPSPTPTPTATPTPIPTPTPPLVCASPVYGPTRFTRTCDDHGPTVYNKTFAPPAGASGPFTLRVRNGDTQGRNKTTSAEVKINGVEVVGESDFSNNVVTFTKTLPGLAASNQLYVRVKGAPNSTFTLEICGANQGDSTPPVVDWLTPAEGEILKDPAPLYRVRYSDTGSGLDLATLKILIDGADQTASFNRQSDEASYDSLTALGDGAHALRAEINDVAGNAGIATRNFRVDATAPTITLTEPSSDSLTRAVRPQIRIAFADAGVLPSGVDAAALRVSIDGVDATSAFTISGGVATGVAPLALADGSHRIDASISDRVGNDASTFTIFTIDTVAPVLTTVHPASGQSFGASSVPIFVQYADNQALNPDSFTATLDGSPLNLTVDADSAEGLASSLADGPHALAVSIADQAGNVGTSTVSFTTDTGNPEVFIVPANGQAINSRNPEIVVTYRDAQGIAPGSLKITVNGVVRTADFTQTALEARATLVDPLPAGLNTITAEVHDGASNPGAASSSFTVDVTPPVITVASPASGAFLNDTTPDIDITLQDEATGIATGVTRVFVDGVDVTADFTPGATGLRGALGAPLAEGPHTLEVLTADGAANPATVTVPFHIDLTPPTLDFASPRVDGYTNDPTPEVWLRLADPQGPLGQTGGGVDLASARVFVLSEVPGEPDTDITPLLNPTAVDTGLRGELAVALADGSHRLRATVRDTAGNESSLTVGFVVDTEAPALVIDAPQSGTFLNSAEPTIVLLYSDTRSGVASDLVQLTVDGVERAASLVAAPGGSTLTLSRSLGFDLADGSHRIEARVVDLAGNAIDAAPVTFGVDTVAPAATVQTPSPQLFTGAVTPAIRFLLTDAAPSSGMNADFAKVLLDGVDVTAAIAFAPTGGLAEPLVLTATGTAPMPLGDGVHTLRITAIDNANNPVELITQFTVDNGAPVLTSDIPEEGRLVGGSALTDGRTTVTGLVTDLDPNLTLTCTAGSGGVVALSANAYSCVVAVNEGPNTITVTATDSTGHAASLARTVTVDRVAPVIAIDQPSAGTFTSALSLAVSGTITDTAAVTVSVNGQAATVTPGAGGGPQTFEAAGVAVGPGPTVSFEVVATDAAGNTATAQASVRVDRTAPVVAITSPAPGAYLRGGVTTVTADVTDETSTILDLNGIPGAKSACVPAGAGAERCSFTAEVPLLAGNASVLATAFDEAGNRGVAQVSAVVDNTPPAITISSPLTGLVTNATSVTATGTVTDASPVTLTINGQSATMGADGAFSVPVTTDVLGVPFAGLEGLRSLVFTAMDAAGNESSVTVAVTFDRAPPALTIASPLQGAVIPAASLSVSGTVADATAVSVTVQGALASVTGQAYSYTVLDAAEGPLTITVRAVDGAGNETTVTREVEIDLGPPVVAITSPAAGALTLEATIQLAYTVSDRSLTTIKVNGIASANCAGVLPCERTQPVTLEEGDNTFTVEATDAGGRTSSAQVTVTRDSTPPTLDLQAPETVSRGRAATASATASDTLALDSLEVRLGSTVICTGVSACSAPIVLPEAARPGDSLTITAEATDRAGNKTTRTRTVRVTTDGVVTGTVLNDLTSLPLSGATVTLLGPTTRSAATDLNGRYNIPVADTSAVLRIEKAGMTAIDRVVSIASGAGTVALDARLTPLAAPTSQSPVVPATNPPAIIPSASPGDVQGIPGPVSLIVPAGSHRVTLLSAQGLPNLLPLGVSPLVAFNWITDSGSAVATASIAMPTGTATLPESILVRYDAAMRDWRIVLAGLLATDGILTADLPGPGSYALVVPDVTVPPVPIDAPGEALAGLTLAPIPATATSESHVDPAVLPPTGGTAVGSLRLDSPTTLPSGTIVQADVEEFYTLASGEQASAAKRSIDLVAFKRTALATAWGAGANAGVISNATASTLCVPPAPTTPTHGTVTDHLCASFPITPSRTYANAGLKEGRVHLDLLAGHESARGIVGGNVATTVLSGNVQLNVAAGSLAEDTAIALFAYDDYSPFLPSTNGITPLAEVTVDLASSILNSLAALVFSNVAAAPGDTLVLVRVDRAAYDGVPRLQVVALADVITANGETRAVTRVDTGLSGVTLEGITHEGRYALLRLAGPIGFIKGSTTAASSAVRALVSTNTLPFIATSNAAGYYAIPGVPGSNTVTARVLGQSLIGTAQAIAIDGTPVTADIALQGTVSQATITPTSGAIAVEVNEPLSLTSPVAIDPTTIQATNITLRRVPPAACSEPTPPSALNCAATEVPLRFVLSGSGKQLAIIPFVPPTTPPTVPTPPSLEFSTNYTLQVTGLLDTVGGLITAPTTTFRTKDDVKPVYNLKALTFSFPNADGLVTVSAPNGTLPPGSEILIINAGNGVVLGVTAGNDGQVSGQIPASLSDTLLVTVTDPFGNTASFQSSKFVNPATGETSIGPGGGVVEGPAGTAIDIPDGALSKGLTMKLEVLTPEQYDTQFPNQRPSFGGRPIGSVLKVSTPEPQKFQRPAKLTFGVPNNFATTHPGADPRDAVFYVLQRTVLPNGTVAFQTIDHAFAVCPGDVPGGDLPVRDDPGKPTCDVAELKVKTASPPHPQFTGNDAVDLYIVLTYDWAGAAVKARQALAGVIAGRVRRQAWGTDDTAGVVKYEPVSGALVYGFDSTTPGPGGDASRPLAPNGVVSVSQADGTYSLWDAQYQGGTVQVFARVGDEVRSGLGYEGNPQDVSASWGPFPALKFYANKAHVDILFEAQQPPPPAPDVEVRVLRDSDRADTGGISTVGTPLRVAFKNNRSSETVTINSLDINGVNFVVTLDPTGTFAALTQDAWTPTQPGTYLLRTTAIAPIGGSVPVSTTVRIVAAGGGIDTDQTQPPRVLDQRTYPKPRAKSVQTSIFPTIAFSEPVVGVTLQTVRLTRSDLTPGPVPPTTTDEAIKITGITASGQVIDDVSQAPTLPITAITIQPLFGLKYKQLYTLTLSDGIQDLDTVAGSPAPKSLVPYTTTFQTFGPESIPPDEGEAQSYTTTGFYVAKNEEGEPVSMWSLKHQIAGSNWFSLLTGYDISDPVNVKETTATSIFGRPMDVAGEGTTLVVGTAPGVRSIPSNVHLYDVSDPASPQWLGSVTLANSANQGTVQRVNLRGNRIYAGTLRRGIQIVDVDFLKSKLVACCSVEYFKMLSDLNLDGQGYGSEALITSIPVSGLGGQLASFTGIKSIPQGADPLIVASGNFGLALAKESAPGAALKVWKPSKDGVILDYGTALDVASVGGYDLAVVAGVFGGKQYLMTVNVTDPVAPFVAGVREVVSDLGIVDVLVNGSSVYVSTQRTTTPPAVATEVFEISDPSNIAHLGRVEGVGGRLAIAGKLLYGATSSTFGAPVDGLGGVRIAALGRLALIDGTSPAVVVVGEGPRAAEDFTLRYRVLPPDIEIATAKVEYRHADSTVGDPVSVLINPDGRGELPVRLGFTFPTVGENVARPRLSVTTTEGDEIVGPVKSWRHEQPTVELVFDDDQEESVTADKPEVEVRVTSAEWYRRFTQAQEKGDPPPPTKDVTFTSVSPAGIVSPDRVVSRDGIFETSLANLVVPAPSHQVRALIGPVTLGISDPAEVLPGPAQTLDLTPTQTDLPLDGATETLITLTAHDLRGNLVQDGTGVFWETNGDGEFVEPREATANGTATIKYRAGESKAGPVTITARVDEVEHTITLQQHPIQVAVALDRAVAFLDTPSIEVTATVTSPGGPISPKATVSAISSSGKMTIIAPLSNGVLRARWEPAGTQYRYGLAFSVAVADARGQSPTIPWRATLTPTASGAEDAAAAGSLDGDAAISGSSEVSAAQPEGEVVPVASAFPAVIAGDKTQDGYYEMELPDGNTRSLPYKTQSAYRITGLIPGERVALSLGSNARPNARTLAHYSGTQGIVNGQAPDDLGQNDGNASGVQAIQEGYQGPAYAFNGSGAITIPYAQALAFSSGFMVQAAVRPPPAANSTLIERTGQFRLDLVNGYPRFTIQSGSAFGSLSESSVTAAQPIPENQWTLVSGRFDGATIKLVAGDYEETVVLSQAPNASASPIVVGHGFGGSLDEIRFFDLSGGPLLTFAGGATETQGVADASGNFETAIRSGGALLAEVPSPAERFAEALAEGADDRGGLGGPSESSLEPMSSGFLSPLQAPPATATQEALGNSIVEVNAIFADSARRETGFIGIAGSEMLARAFLVIGGTWGAGPPDDPYVMAGDIVLGTIVQAISTPRDLFNAFDHARKGHADKFEILTIAMAAAGAASVVFSKKAAILGKFRKLPKLLASFGPAAEANRTLGKRLLKGIKEIADDLPGGKTLENVAEAAETVSGEGRQALAKVVNTAGDQGSMLDKVETIVKNAPDREGVIKAMGEAEERLPKNKFKAMLSVAGACAIGAAAADGPGAACPIPDPATVGAWTKALGLGASEAHLAKIVLRSEDGLDAAKDVAIRLSKAIDGQAENTLRIVSDLGHPSRNKAFGAQAVLRVGTDILDSVPATQRVGLALKFEQSVSIPVLLTAKGNIRSRVYDVVYKSLDGLRRIEVKRWVTFPPKAKYLREALDQFDRDFVAHFTVPGFNISQLRWKFPDLDPAHRAALAKEFVDRISGSEAVKEALKQAGVNHSDALNSLKNAASTLFEFR